MASWSTCAHSRVKVQPSVAKLLVANNLGDRTAGGHICLKLGILWGPSRNGDVGGHPDLNKMRREEPQRYAEIWRGNREAHIGKGALGRVLDDHTVHLCPGKRLKPSLGREL